MILQEDQRVNSVVRALIFNYDHLHSPGYLLATQWRGGVFAFPGSGCIKASGLLAGCKSALLDVIGNPSSLRSFPDQAGAHPPAHIVPQARRMVKRASVC
jgi:hypothetical protein